MDHGFRISMREAVEPYAKLTVSGPAFDVAAELKATIYGPKCAYARTLPTTFTPSARETGRINFLMQDPCYWTPALPFSYELSVECVNLAGELSHARSSFGLRRLTQRRNSLYLEGKRFVPRGVHASALSDDLAIKARSAEVALIMPTPSSEVMGRANVHGIPLIADLRGHAVDQAPWLGSTTLYPSILMTLIDRRQVDELKAIGPADDVLIAIVMGPNDSILEASLTARRYLIAVEFGPGDRPPAWVADCGRPVIAIRRGAAYADFHAARAACDRLQTDLAPEFDLAGYFV